MGSFLDFQGLRLCFALNIFVFIFLNPSHQSTTICHPKQFLASKTRKYLAFGDIFVKFMDILSLFQLTDTCDD